MVCCHLVNLASCTGISIDNIMQITIRAKKEEADAITRLMTHVNERTATKALIKAAADYPAKCTALIKSQRELHKLNTELSRLRKLARQKCDIEAEMERYFDNTDGNRLM